MPRLTGLVPAACLIRHLPLVFGPSPRTPLRVLCIVALDTLHVLWYARPLPRHRRDILATLLDFQAATNALWDRKPLRAEYDTLRQRLEQAGLAPLVCDYLRRLGELEWRRPPVGGHARRFGEVRAYREAVVRLSLATVAAAALNTSLDEAIRATHDDTAMTALLSMAMQCQIIDDVLDYRKDWSAGLPSFLTASGSLGQSAALTVDAARSYQQSVGPRSGRTAFGLRVALGALSAVAVFAVRWVTIRARLCGLRPRTSSPATRRRGILRGGPTGVSIAVGRWGVPSGRVTADEPAARSTEQ